jgi:hypothetical protein
MCVLGEKRGKTCFPYSIMWASIRREGNVRSIKTDRNEEVRLTDAICFNQRSKYTIRIRLKCTYLLKYNVMSYRSVRVEDRILTFGVKLSYFYIHLYVL